MAATSGDLAALLRDVVVAYGARRALDGFHLEIPQAQVTALLGPNGAGKSSTIGLLAGLLRAQSGHVEVLFGAAGRPEARNLVGVMLQDDGLPTGAHAAEMVKHVASLRGAPETATRLIDLLDLGKLGRTTIRRLSGGERRRVSLACALVGHPRLVLLDEPTAGLDQQGRDVVAQLVRERREAGVSILLSTHLLDEAETLADRITIIAHGRNLATGSLADITAGSSDRISFDSRAHLDVESLARALPAICRVEETEPGRYTIWGSADPQVLATVSAWCAQHGAAPTSITAGRESLTEAYRRITRGGPQ